VKSGGERFAVGEKGGTGFEFGLRGTSDRDGSGRKTHVCRRCFTQVYPSICKDMLIGYYTWLATAMCTCIYLKRLKCVVLYDKIYT
jgi:hypothetical protein